MMETPGGGILGRLGEKVLGYIALGLLVAGGAALWRSPETAAAIWNGVWRTAVWLVIAAALPWITRLFVSRILEIGSNWAGVILLACLVLADAIAGVLLLSGWPSGWGWVAALAALAVAGTYNYLVTEYLSQQAGA